MKKINLSQCSLLFFDIYIIDKQYERKNASAIMYAGGIPGVSCTVS